MAVASESLNKTNNNSVIESISSFKSDIIHQLYKECFPSVKFMVTSNSGTIDDAEDIFQEVLVHILEKARKNQLHLTSSIKTYIYSVCYNMWQGQLWKKSKIVRLNDYTDLPDDSDYDQLIYENNLYELFLSQFESLSDEYQKILNMYLAKCSMEEITNTMGYKNEKYAKFRKFKIKEVLKENILNSMAYKEISCKYSN
jgi:RNA polymerase sigma factor (sigma-70 family)